MSKPKLQIALDSQSLSEALETVREVGDVVDVKVLQVDMQKKRIQLSMIL